MSLHTEQHDRVKAYLLKGEDDFQKERRLEELLRSLVAEDFADFDLEQLEGDSATADRVMSGLHVPPFSSQQRVVLVRHANKMNPDEQQRLASQLANAPDSGCLILVNPAVEKRDGKTPKGSEVVGDVSRAVRKIGKVLSFGRPKADRAQAFAQSIFADASKKISPATLAAFIQRVGTDSSIVATEAQKLIDYAGDADEISSQDVTVVTSETPEEKVFKLVDAVAARNQASALALLGELFDAGNDPRADAPRTLGMIARQLRLLWQVKMLSEAGVKTFDRDAIPNEIKEALPSQPNVLDVVTRQKWMAASLARQARPFSRGDLVRSFSAIARADLMLKGMVGGIDDPRTVMELLVIQLASPVKQSTARTG